MVPPSSIASVQLVSCSGYLCAHSLATAGRTAKTGKLRYQQARGALLPRPTLATVASQRCLRGLLGGVRSPLAIGSRRAPLAREVPEAIRKATDAAKRGLVRVPLPEGRPLHHDVEGRHGAGKVFLRAASAGTGIIAGGPMRAVFETLGIQDVVAKSIGSSNPYNMVRATFNALKHQDSPRSVAARRNIKVSALQARRLSGDAEVVAE